MNEVMALAHVADPDLVIRTGAEQRISNFCCGRPLILNSISATNFGLSLMKKPWILPLRISVVASDDLGKLPIKSVANLITRSEHKDHPRC